MKKSRINIILVFLAFIVISTYIIFNSQTFNSKNVIIKGNNIIKDDIIIYMSGIKSDKNIFKYKINQIEETLEESNYINSAKVSRNMPDTIIIEIQENNIGSILKNEDMYSYVDEQGKYIDSLNYNEYSHTDKVLIEVDYTVEDNNIKFDNEDYTNQIPILINTLHDEKLEKEIDRIIINKENMSIYDKNNIEFIVKDLYNIEYDIKRISKILVDFQTKSITKGVVDLTEKDYAIYRP